MKGAEWFDPSNTKANLMREECQKRATSDMIDFLNMHSNGVAILDSTNPTHERRRKLVQMVILLFNLCYLLVIFYFAN